VCPVVNAVSAHHPEQTFAASAVQPGAKARFQGRASFPHPTLR